MVKLKLFVIQCNYYEVEKATFILILFPIQSNILISRRVRDGDNNQNIILLFCYYSNYSLKPLSILQKYNNIK